MNESADKLRGYLEHPIKYVKHDLQEYLQLIERKDINVSFPYLLLCFASMDLLGGLKHGFNGKHSNRIMWFISTWLSEANDRYSDPKIPKFLVDFARGGLVHKACVQHPLFVNHTADWRALHLTTGGEGLIRIHTPTFVDETVQAIEDCIRRFDAVLTVSEQRKAWQSIETDRENSGKRRAALDIDSIGNRMKGSSPPSQIPGSGNIPSTGKGTSSE